MLSMLLAIAEFAGTMDKERFVDSVNKFSDSVYRICIMYMKNKHDSEDICQETFLKLYLSDANFENEEHEKSWLLKVAANLCKNELSKSKRHKCVELNENIVSSDRAESKEVINLILNLPDKYRGVLYLFYYEGYKCSEIASMLTLNESTVRTRLSRGRELLKELYT